MRNHRIPLYNGAVLACWHGSFILGGQVFDVIRPGIDIQGQTKHHWVQIVHGGIPVYTMARGRDIPEAIRRFEARFKTTFGKAKPSAVETALRSVKAEHLQKFQDGQSGLEPAPTVTHDEPPGPVSYVF